MTNLELEPPPLSFRRSLSPPQGSERSPRLLRWLVVPLIIEVLSWQGFVLVGYPGLDPSWQAGLEMALHFHLSFGQQAVFTYGPLGFLTVGNSGGITTWYGSLALIALLYALVLRFVLSAAIFNAARVSYGSVIGFVLALIGVAMVETQFADLTLILIALVWAIRRGLAQRDELLFAGGIAAFAAFESLQKISIGVTAVVMVCVFVLTVDSGRRRVVTGAVAAGTFAVVLLALWLAIGQPLSALPQYARSAYEISSGYSAAMSVDQGGFGWAVTAAFMLMVAGLWAARQATVDLPARRRAAVLIIWALFWFSAFKEGFVRQDTAHLPIFFAAMLGACFAFPIRPGLRKLGIASLAVAVLALLAASGQTLTGVVHLQGSVSEFSSDLRQLINPDDRAKVVSETRSSVLTGEPRLPKGSLALLRGRTVALYPTELDLVWAHRLDWRPLPVLQSYSAYTPWLDRLVADSLASNQAPARLIVQAGSSGVDGRFVHFDEPLATLQMFCRYRPILRDAHYGIFAHTRDRCSAPRLIRTVHVAWGQTLRVPTPPGPRSLVIGQVLGAQPAGLERIFGVLYKPAQRGIIINRTADLRLVAATAADGLPLLTSPGVDYPWPYTVTPEATTIAVTKGADTQPAARGALTVRFSVITVRPWAPKRHRASVATVKPNG